MAEINPTTTLLEDFQALPEAIKNWLASIRLTSLISDINQKLGLQEEKRKILPQLILRLAVADLNPEDFIGEMMQELKINFQTAKALAQEIITKSLNPIEAPLREEMGIDIKLILTAQPPAQVQPVQAPAETPKAPATAPIAKPQAAPAQPAIQPRILYQEKREVSSGQNVIKPVLFRNEYKPVPIHAAAVQPDFFEQRSLPKTARVVHYSGAVTPVEEFSANANSELDSFIIDLRASN